jgi:two-component system, LytTR family, sensor kinase
MQRLSVNATRLSSALGYAVGAGRASKACLRHEGSLNSAPHLARSDESVRLKRGAGRLMVAFWTVHLVIMLVRAELNIRAGQRGLDDVLQSIQLRTGFALFGAFLCYVLYRCLRLLRHRTFGQQMAIGAALALATACIQATGNALLFARAEDHFFVSFLYALLYWFWFYFSWTTAYLALSYSITLQEQERQGAQLRLQAQEAQVRALRYQINPHFLFNTLNAIAALIRDAPPKAEEMVVQLSDFFRRSLAVNPMEDVTLAEEVELQRLYLEIERTRFPDRLQLDVALDDGSAEARVPPLLLQPLVENAVKHGVARSEGPTRIRIRARVDGPVLEVVVENDAKASGPASGGEKVGLHNVSARLHSRYGDEASLVTSEIEEGGFRNTLRMPLRL